MALEAVHQVEENPAQILVFLHGITGDSKTTWEAPSPPNEVPSEDDNEPALWVSKLLPNDFNANIYTCGWDWTVPNTMHDLAGSFIKTLSSLADNVLRQKHKSFPIVLVGHDLGGIIIQKAMLMFQDLSADPRYLRIAANIAGIILIDTPFEGTVGNFYSDNQGIEPLVNPQDNELVDTSYLELLHIQSSIRREVVADFYQLVIKFQQLKTIGPLTCFCSGSPQYQFDNALLYMEQVPEVKWRIIEVLPSRSDFNEKAEPEYKEFVKQVRDQIDFRRSAYRWIDMSDCFGWSTG